MTPETSTPRPQDALTPRSDLIWRCLLEILSEYDKKKVYFSDVANACYAAKCDTQTMERELTAQTARLAALEAERDAAVADRNIARHKADYLERRLEAADNAMVRVLPDYDVDNMPLAGRIDFLGELIGMFRAENAALRKDGERLERLANVAGFTVCRWHDGYQFSRCCTSSSEMTGKKFPTLRECIDGNLAIDGARRATSTQEGTS